MTRRQCHQPFQQRGRAALADGMREDWSKGVLEENGMEAHRATPPQRRIRGEGALFMDHLVVPARSHSQVLGEPVLVQDERLKELFV